jgi:hypothetical protein
MRTGVVRWLSDGGIEFLCIIQVKLYCMDIFQNELFLPFQKALP